MERAYRSALIIWTWQDVHVEDPTRVEQALADIAAHGFAGVLAMLRGCRYELSDPLVIMAARHAAEAAHRRGLLFWFALDPRLDQGRLLAQGEAAVYLLPQRHGSGALACEGPVTDGGRYKVRIEYGRPRGQHMLSRVAVTFRPEGVEQVFAYRKGADGRVVASSVRDVTAGARLFVNNAQGYLEIFGRLSDLDGEGWQVLALPRCRSDYPDLGSAATRAAMIDLYRQYHAAGVRLDGVFWDEIGYVSGYGSDQTRLPYGEAVCRQFQARHGSPLPNALLWLLLEDDIGQAARVRRDYYAAVQDAVIGAQAACYAEARRLWGQEVESGIHQTWHQNADDLPHGSADWWRGSVALSGGFTDVGHAEEWEREEHVAQLLAMAAIAVTLARFHPRQTAFYNLWGVDFGEERSRHPADVMDWWAHVLSAFGITWLAHTYGPNGYIDNVTNWGPGYPDHPSWERFPEINERIARVRAITGGGLPEARVAVVYPLGTLTRIGSARANPVAEDAQRVVSRLIRQRVGVDVISPDLLIGGRVQQGALWLRTPRGEQRYDTVVYPHPDTLQPAELEQLLALQREGVPVVLLGMPPCESTDGRSVNAAALLGIATSAGERWRLSAGVGRSQSGSVTYLERSGAALDDLAYSGVDRFPRLLTAPEGSLANLFRRPGGELALTIVPADYGRPVSGIVSCQGLTVEVQDLRGIAAIRFAPNGSVRDQFVHQGTLR